MASSCTRIWFSKARSPTSTAVRPTMFSSPGAVACTEPSPASRCPTRAARSRACGVRTSTKLRVLRWVNSETGPFAIIRPRPMTTSSSAISAISLSRWLETKTDRPSEASALSRSRIQRMPCGSRPLAGSSRISVCGLPSSAAASPSRWPMPSENVLGFLPATSARPTMPSTSSTRPSGMSLAAASIRRWLRAVRVGWNGLASSSAPTSRMGCWMLVNGRPSKVQVPSPRSRPSIRRIVVDFPEPLGPRNPVTVPGRTSNDRLDTAVLPP